MPPWKLSSVLELPFRLKAKPTPKGSCIDTSHVAFWIKGHHSHFLELMPQQTIERKAISKYETLVFTDKITPNISFPDTDESIIGWYQCHCDITQGTWNTFVGSMLCKLQARLRKKRGYSSRPGADQGYLGVDPLWTIRGFFIGPSINYAPPYITVLCSDNIVSQWLIKFIQAELASGRYPGWCVTRLPYISVIAYVSPPRSTDDGDDEGSVNVDKEPKRSSEDDAEGEDNLHMIQVEVDANYAVPTMVNGNLPSWEQNRHRCGIRLQITRGLDTIAEATMGGLIQVGNKLYGLTVAHSFSLALNKAGSDVQADDQISHILHTWQQSPYFDIESDLALIEIPGLWDQTPSPEFWEDINLVRTVSGVFRPVSIAWSQPRPLDQVVLSTHRSSFCLRGIFIGSQALMPISNSMALCTPWILRMERPWLIQPGDSGSWAFNAHTGELLGMLIAGCSELLEAYILPAYQAFNNIEKRLGDPVTLPNCQPLQKQDWEHLAPIVDNYDKILTKMMPSPTPEDLEAIEDDAVRWTSEWATVAEDCTKDSSSSFRLRITESSWQSPLEIVDCIGLLVSEITTMMLLDTTPPGQSLQQCIDDVNEMMRSPEKRLNERGRIFRIWGCLMVGENRWENEDYTRDVVRNEWNLIGRWCYSPYSMPRIPWDRRTLKSVLDVMKLDMQRNLRDMKTKCGWFSLPETMQTVLVDGRDVILTALRIMDWSNHLALVVMPPPTVGPRTHTLSSGSRILKGSSLRYPFKLGIETRGAAEDMKDELMSKMELDATDFDYVRKLPLKRGKSTLYLKEHRRRVKFVVYEGVLKLNRKLPTIKFAEEWVTMHKPLDNSVVEAMAPPFQWLTWMEDKGH